MNSECDICRISSSISLRSLIYTVTDHTQERSNTNIHPGTWLLKTSCQAQTGPETFCALDIFSLVADKDCIMVSRLGVDLLPFVFHLNAKAEVRESPWMRALSARPHIVLRVWQTRSCDMGSADPDRRGFVLLLCNLNSSHNTNAICL